MTMRPPPRARSPHRILFAGSLAATLALGCSDGRIAILDGTTYTPDGHLVVFGWPIRVYDSALRAASPAIPSPADRSEITAAALSPDGTLGLVAHSHVATSSTPVSATVFRIPTGQMVSRFSFSGFIPPVGGDVGGFALSPQGDLAFLVSEVRRSADGALLWSTSTTLYSPVFSADGGMLVAIGFGPTTSQTSYQATLMAFDAATGAPIYANGLGEGSEMDGISLVGDGSRLAAILTTCQSRGCWEYLVTFSTADGKLISKVPVPVGVTLASRDGRAGFISCARTQDLCASSYRDDTSRATALWRTDGTVVGTLAKVSVSSSTDAEPPPHPRLSADGSALALVGPRAVTVYRVSDGGLVGAIRTEDRP